MRPSRCTCDKARATRLPSRMTSSTDSGLSRQVVEDEVLGTLRSSRVVEGHDVLVGSGPRQGLRLAPRAFRVGERRSRLNQRHRNSPREHGIVGQVGALSISFAQEAPDPVAPSEYRAGLQGRFLCAVHCALQFVMCGGVAA